MPLTKIHGTESVLPQTITGASVHPSANIPAAAIAGAVLMDKSGRYLSPGPTVILRDANNNVSEVRETMANGALRTTVYTRNPAGDVLSYVVSFSDIPETKTYTITRDPNGVVTGVTEV